MNDNDQEQEVQEESKMENNTDGGGSKTTQLVIIVVVVLALVGGGFYFLSKRKDESPEPTVTTPTQDVTQSEVAPNSSASASPITTGKVKSFTVSGTEYSFSPNKLSVNKGDHVKLTFKNVGKMTHNFVIDEFGVTTKTISGGESDTVEFTPTDSGTFTFYCSIGNHKALGMVGTLTVK